MVTDVVVVGGGAAGLCAAVYLKQNNPNLCVRILESTTRVGKKLALTGNGRCNITNKNIEISRYHGEDVSFCEYALCKYDRVFCEDFFEKIGVSFVFEGDKAYPASLQAASVVDCLRFACDNWGVITHTEAKVSKITLSGGNYKLSCGNINFLARRVIIATGLLSGGDRLGCDGSMLEFLKKSGFETVETSPAIVQLKTVTDIVKQLKGIKTNALVTLKKDGKKVRQEFGEVLFCDYGLSGPPILQVSREVSRNGGQSEISLDIMPDFTFDGLFDKLSERQKRLSYLNLDEFLTGFLNKRLGQVILKNCGLKLSDSVSTLDKKALCKVAENIKNFNFKVISSNGFLNSQVTAGGLKTSGFCDKTMMSKASRGLYAAGEILDIDGDCGGFNLQWAWSSAFCAADAILKEAKK